jgi:exopolysaccharide production protein ExoQ
MFVLVILTEIEPKLAFRIVLRRCGYVLLLLSIVLAKYFPCGASYSEWTGAKMIIGVTQAKNLLGQDCLLFGLFFICEIIMQWKDRESRRDFLVLSVNLFMAFLAIKLLLMSDSITSLVCMGLGAAIMFAAGFDSVRKNIATYILSASLSFLFLNWSLEIMPNLIESLGRDTTLTDRTDIWDLLLPMAKTNLWFGSGYENFWMGDRLLKIWPLVGRINEAHNGYLEIVLDTGVVGLAFFINYLVSAYHRCKQDLLSNPDYGRFAMAFFFTMLVYNFTEAAFKSLCILFFVLLTNSFRIPETSEASADDCEQWQTNDHPLSQISLNTPTAWQQ